MSDAIQVDEEVLLSQIERLQNLTQDNELRSYCTQSIAPILSKSTGINVTSLQELHQELDAIIGDMYTLAQRTLDFLTNANTSFIVADAGLAERIATGNI